MNCAGLFLGCFECCGKRPNRLLREKVDTIFHGNKANFFKLNAT